VYLICMVILMYLTCTIAVVSGLYQCTV